MIKNAYINKRDRDSGDFGQRLWPFFFPFLMSYRPIEWGLLPLLSLLLSRCMRQTGSSRYDVNGRSADRQETFVSGEVTQERCVRVFRKVGFQFFFLRVNPAPKTLCICLPSRKSSSKVTRSQLSQVSLSLPDLVAVDTGKRSL